MNKLSISQAEHKGIKAGHPSVEGWMIDSKRIVLEDTSINAKASKEYNTNGRNFSVFVNDKYVGTVYYMTGGQYAALDLEHNQISTYTGNGAEFKCFIDIVLENNKK